MVSRLRATEDRREREAGPGRGPSGHLIWLGRQAEHPAIGIVGRFKLVQEPKISLDPRPLPPHDGVVATSCQSSARHRTPAAIKPYSRDVGSSH